MSTEKTSEAGRQAGIPFTFLVLGFLLSGGRMGWGEVRNTACTYSSDGIICNFPGLDWEPLWEEILLSSRSLLSATNLIVFLPCCALIYPLIHLLS